MGKSNEILLVLTTVATQEDARRLAKSLVEQRVAGCVQIDGPVESHYHWDGQLCLETEYRCTIKTLPNAYDTLEAAIRKLHPYQVPQIIRLSGSAADAFYHWLSGEVS